MSQIMNYISENWISTLLTFLSTGALFCIKRIFKYLQTEEQKIAAMQIGMQALIRGQIIDYYNKYMDLQYCPIYIKDTVKRLEKAYLQLCEEDSAKELLYKILNLPTERKERDDEF
jgi:hypothetical protein